MKILLVDDHHLIRDGMRALLQSLGKGIFVLDAGTAGDALAIAQKQPVNGAIVDYQLPDMNGIALMEVLQMRHRIPVMIISGIDDPGIEQLAIDSGASGFLTKGCSQDVLRQAVNHLLSGRVILPEDRGEQTPAENDPFSALALTPRQRDVLDLLVRGLPNKMIASRLNMSEPTVKTHVTAILKQFGAKTRSQVISLALRLHAATGNPIQD